ncbi:MAG: aminotransferase class I/II-fold pyridoxal phosphate-dependent enzyme [Bifidobacterium sp.]|jgi:aminotransferase
MTTTETIRPSAHEGRADGVVARRVHGIPSNPFAVSDVRVAQARAAGAEIIDLSKGNPDGQPPDFMVETAARALRDPANFRYPPFRGKPGFLQAASGWYRREFGVSLDPGTQLLAVAGAGVGISVVIETLIDPGDLVVLVDPYYPQYAGSTAVAQGVVHRIEARPELGFLPDLDAVDPAVWDRARLLILNYPNNPTGAAATPQLFATAVRLAREHHVIVMHDFAYAGIGFDDHPPISLLQTPGAMDVGVEVCSLSKMYMIAGWRGGFIASGARLMESIVSVDEQTSLMAGSITQDAGAAGLNSDQSSVRVLAKRYANRYHAVRRALAEAGLELEISHGGLFAWMRVPPAWNDEDFSVWLLSHAHVAVIPGSDFGPSGRRFVRLSLLVPQTTLVEAAQRIRRARGAAW